MSMGLFLELANFILVHILEYGQFSYQMIILSVKKYLRILMKKLAISLVFKYTYIGISVLIFLTL